MMVVLYSFAVHLCVYTLITPVCCAFSAYQHQKIISRLPPLFATTTIDDDVDSKVSPFNHDIARTIFAPLFFSLYYDNKNDNNNEVRHQYQRPSPFEDPSCAQTSERMLRRMLDNRSRSDGRTVCPDSQTFSLVAGAYGRLRYKGSKKSKIVTWEAEQSNNGEVGGRRVKVTSTDKLQQLLQLQLQLCNNEGWPSAILPSVEMYNRVLKRLAQNQNRSRYQQKDDEVSAAEQAWLWLQIMKSPLPHNEKRTLCQPNVQTYLHIISALTSYHEQTRKMNTKLLIDTPLKQIYEPIEYLAKQIDIEIERPPSKLTLDWCLHEAEALLTIIEDEYNSRIEKNVDLSTDKMKDTLAHAYKCILEGWSRYAVIKSKVSKVDHHHHHHQPARAYELLTRLEELPNTTSVSSSCYSSVILALSVSNLPTAATDAEDVLQRMMNQCGINQPSDINLVSANFNVNDVSKAFSGCIAAHAKNNDAPQADLVLSKMIELYDSGKLGDDFAPEPRAFGTCISLWAKYDPKIREERRQRGGKDLIISREQRLHNADRAETILSELEGIAISESDKGNEMFKLNATPFNLAILARCQTTMKSDKYNNNREENEKIILHAQSILDHMEYEIGVPPDPYTYATLLNSWCQESAPGNEKAADQAEELLRRRIEDVDIEILDREWSTAKREARSVEIWPNVKHYSSVLSAHAKTKSAAGARKALALLSEMEARFYNSDVVNEDGNSDDDDTSGYHIDKKESCKPDLICYSIVIDAFANSRLPEASSVALRLLKAVETKYEAGGDVSMKPNARLYTAVILSLVHSPLLDDDLSDKHTNNAQRAWAILEKMIDNDVQPNAYTYNYIINCAAESASGDIDDQKVSFEIALRAFQALRKDGLCDSFTFAFMIKACNNLLPSGELRSKVISKTFVECCQNGHLNDTILDRLWRGLTPTQFYKLVGEEKPGVRDSYLEKSPIKTNQLPEAWSANSMKKWCTNNRSFKKKRD